MTDVAHIHEDMLVDIDGMVQTPADFSNVTAGVQEGKNAGAHKSPLGGGHLQFMPHTLLLGFYHVGRFSKIL